MGIGPHAPGADGGELAQLLHQGAVPIKELPGPVALEPLLEETQLFGILVGGR